MSLPEDYTEEKTSVASFSIRWLALSIDLITSFIICLLICQLLNLPLSFVVLIPVQVAYFAVIPSFFKGLTIGRLLLKIKLDTKTPKASFIRCFLLREISKLILIYLTAGLYLIVQGLILAETAKPTLHEKISGLRTQRSVTVTRTNDPFDGKFRL